MRFQLTFDGIEEILEEFVKDIIDNQEKDDYEIILNPSEEAFKLTKKSVEKKLNCSN